jgi:monoamine oxidase
MPTETVDTMIIGGGLSGIYAAYLLSQKNKPFIVLEARERIGGRILSPEHQEFFSDLGPSWYWPEIHPKMGVIDSLKRVWAVFKVPMEPSRPSAVTPWNPSAGGFPAA